MSTKNPQTVPEKATKPQETPGGDNGADDYFSNVGPDDSKSVPRSAGVVSATGNILDDSGQTIGKIADSKDPKELVGNTVTASGDVVNSAGDVLGQALLGDDSGDYTTKPEDEGQEEEKKEGGLNLSSATKGVTDTVSGATKLTGSLGLGKGDDSAEAEKPQTKSETQFDETDDQESPAATRDQDTQQLNGDAKDLNGVKDDTQEAVKDQQPEKKVDEATEDVKDAPSEAKDQVEESKDTPAVGDKATEAAGDAKEKTAEAAEDTKDKVSDAAEQTKEKAGDAVEGTKDKAEDVTEETKDKAADATEDTKDKSEDVAEKAEDKSEDVAEEAKDKAPDATGAAEDTKDKAADAVDTTEDKAANATEDSKDKSEDVAEEAKDKTTDATDDTKDKSEDVAEEAKDKSADAVESTEDKTADVAQDTKDESENAADTAEDKAGDVADETKEKVDETKEKADDAVDEAQDKAPSTEDAEANVPVDEKKQDEAEVPTEEKSKDDVEATGEDAKADIPSGEDAKDDAPSGEEVKDAAATTEEDAKAEVPSGEEAKDDVATGEETKEGEEAGEEAPKPDEEKPEGEEAEAKDYSALKGTKVNKAGNLVNKNGDVIGRVVEGDPKKLLGKRADENGDIWDDSGKKIGKAEPLPDNEREDLKEFAPFENFPDAVVEADGRVLSDGKQVGVVVEGDPKRLKGSKVDEDGDILDRRGNVVGKAQAWDEPEAEPEKVVDNSILAGKRVNKAGNVVDTSGVIYGRVIEGNVKSMIGRMCDKEGNIRSEAGDIIGKAELVPEGEREGSKEGPFAEMSGLTVSKDGKVVTAAGDVVGRLIKGDPKTLAGRSVDEDGDVVDRNGNVLAKAERWEEPEVEKKKDPLAGRRVDREGNVRDDDGNVIGKLIAGELGICSGKEVDDDGDVVNSKGQTVGHVSRLEDIPPEPEQEPEETEEQRKEREKTEQETEKAEKDKKLAGQLAYVVEQSLEKIRPICKRITDHIDRAERTPKEELDEEQLVKQVKPLIEDGGKILSEANGAIRGMDPDGRIQRNAKQKSASRDATPEEYHLADVLKELTGTVTECIDNAKRKIDDMPHAKKELNPLWGLLAEPLFQILAAVGLLLNGVLGLVGRLLSGLGLGGLVDNLLGGLGINKILDSLGLGSVLGALTGKDKKKK